MVKIFNFRQNCFHVCKSSQSCTGIILLGLSSEGLFIQLQKIFCCWGTQINKIIHQCMTHDPLFTIHNVYKLYCKRKALQCVLKVSKYTFSMYWRTLKSYFINLKLNRQNDFFLNIIAASKISCQKTPHSWGRVLGLFHEMFLSSTYFKRSLMITVSFAPLNW